MVDLGGLGGDDRDPLVYTASHPLPGRGQPCRERGWTGRSGSCSSARSPRSERCWHGSGRGIRSDGCCPRSAWRTPLGPPAGCWRTFLRRGPWPPGWAPGSAGPRAVRVRRAAVPHRAAALPPLAAGGLDRRGRSGRMGPGLRVRSTDSRTARRRRTRSAWPGRPGTSSRSWRLGGEGLIAATGLAAIASLAFRYRRAGTAKRAQLKWLLYAGAVIVVAFARRSSDMARTRSTTWRTR